MDDYLRWAQPFAHAVSGLYPQGIGEKEVAAVLAFCYPLAMMIGRFAGTVLMKTIKAHKLLAFLGVLGVVLMVVGMFSTGHVAIWSLILCGFANSIMYPTIFALGIAELGPLTSKGSGVITIGNFGGAVLPPLFGLIADKSGYQHRVRAGEIGPVPHQFIRPSGAPEGLLFVVLASPCEEEIGSEKGRFGMASLPQCATNDCTTVRQRLERIATRFARKRDTLNRPAAKAVARKLKKYD
jgi:MFS family permease